MVPTDPVHVLKGLILLFLSGFVPVSALSFLLVRRSKKAAEFARIVRLLGIAEDHAEFARDRVAEQYAFSDYRMPVMFAWVVSALGLAFLLFGADLVSQNPGKVDFLLTGAVRRGPEEMQALRIQNMVVMTLAFLGAFIWSAHNVLYRLNAGDLAPSVYFSAGLRMILAPVLSLMISHLATAADAPDGMQATLPAVAFLVGWFPDRALLFLKERTAAVFRDRQSAGELPLGMIEGVGPFDRARLLELGIADAQNLASANFIELVVRTAFNPHQIIDWIGQAKLYIYFGDAVLALRKHQIRTVFDLVAAGHHPAVLEGLAAATSIDPVGMRLFCDRQSADPGVAQLLSFQRRLCGDRAAQTSEVHGDSKPPESQ